MATTSFRHMDQFNSDNETIAAYLERIELYFYSNEIPEDKKIAVFLSVIGGENLLTLEKLSDKNYTTLVVDTLRKHFEPKKVAIDERFHFHPWNQAPGESITEHVTVLRRLTTDCNFRAHSFLIADHMKKQFS